MARMQLFRYKLTIGAGNRRELDYHNCHSDELDGFLIKMQWSFSEP